MHHGSIFACVLGHICEMGINRWNKGAKHSDLFQVGSRSGRSNMTMSCGTAKTRDNGAGVVCGAAISGRSRKQKWGGHDAKNVGDRMWLSGGFAVKVPVLENCEKNNEIIKKQKQR